MLRFPPPVVAIVGFSIWFCLAASVAAQESATSEKVPVAIAPTQLNQGAAEILKLARAKIHDDVTVAFIQKGDRRYSLTANEIVYLRQEGVSDRVLTAMLNQQPQAGAAPLLQEEAPTTVVSASAPQYDTPPPTTAVVETAPASTVYVVPSTPIYYSFYDPWPYYWSSAWPYWGPYVSFGFYWGWDNWGNNCYWDGNYYHNGKYHHNDDYRHKGKSPNGTPPPNGNRPTPGGNPGSAGKTGMLASGDRSRTGADPATFNRGANPGPGTPSPARPTSYWSNNGNQSTTSRTGQSQVNAAPARSREGAGPTSIWSGGNNNRTAAASPNPSPRAPQYVASGNNSIPTRTWISSTARGNTPQAASAVPSTRSNPNPIILGNRSASELSSRSVARSAASYQRSASPSYGPRPVPNSPSISRASMSPSSHGMGNTSSFRSGNSFGGSGAPRMSPSGGSRVGGGGGGRSR